jgi:hypothetical protein
MAFNHFQMAHSRSAIALDPRHFGRGRVRLLDAPQEQGWGLSDDMKLFAGTFAAGFLFVSILIS